MPTAAEGRERSRFIVSSRAPWIRTRDIRTRTFFYLTLTSLIAILCSMGLELASVPRLAAEARERLDWGIASEAANYLEAHSFAGEEPADMLERLRWLPTIRRDVRIFRVQPDGAVSAPRGVSLVRPRIQTAEIRKLTAPRRPDVPLYVDDPAAAEGKTPFVAARLSDELGGGFLVVLFDTPPLATVIDKLPQILQGVLAAVAFAVICSLALSLLTLSPIPRLQASLQRILHDDARLTDPLPSSRFYELSDGLRRTTGSLAAALRELRESESRTKDVLAKLVHDLRSPITALGAFLEHIIDAAKDPLHLQEDGSFARQTESARIAVGRLRELVRPLVEYATATELKDELTVRSFDLLAVAEQVVLLHDADSRSRDVQLGLVGSSDLCTVEGDRVLVSRVISNLVSNALRYTPAGGTVTVELARESSGSVGVRVRDSGIGIDAAALSALGTPFFRAHAGSPEDQPGTGLGLASVKTVLALHHSTLHIESKVGKGSTFSFTLPKRWVEAETAEAIPAGPAERITTRELLHTNLLCAATFLLSLWCWLYTASGSAAVPCVTALVGEACLLIAIRVTGSRRYALAVAGAMLLAGAAGGIAYLESIRRSLFDVMLGLTLGPSLACAILIPTLRPVRWFVVASILVVTGVAEVQHSGTGLSIAVVVSLLVSVMIQWSAFAGPEHRYGARVGAIYIVLLITTEVMIGLLTVTPLIQMGLGNQTHELASRIRSALDRPFSGNWDDFVGYLVSTFPAGSFIRYSADGQATGYSFYGIADRGVKDFVFKRPCGEYTCFRIAADSGTRGPIRAMSHTRLSDGSELYATDESPTGITTGERIAQRIFMQVLLLPLIVGGLLNSFFVRSWYEREITGRLVSGMGPNVSRSGGSRRRFGKRLEPDDSIQALRASISTLQERLQATEESLRESDAAFHSLLGSFGRLLDDEASRWNIELGTGPSGLTSEAAEALLARVRAVTVALAGMFQFAALRRRAELPAAGKVDLIELVYEAHASVEATGAAVELADHSSPCIVEMSDLRTLERFIEHLVFAIVFRNGPHVRMVISLAEAKTLRLAFERGGTPVALLSESAAGLSSLAGDLHAAAAAALESKLTETISEVRYEAAAVALILR